MNTLMNSLFSLKIWTSESILRLGYIELDKRQSCTFCYSFSEFAPVIAPHIHHIFLPPSSVDLTVDTSVLCHIPGHIQISLWHFAQGVVDNYVTMAIHILLNTEDKYYTFLIINWSSFCTIHSYQFHRNSTWLQIQIKTEWRKDTSAQQWTTVWTESSCFQDGDH